jgi:ADP-heptose:LPS heptosyltransferase
MNPKIIYFIPWGGLGDALLATPALACIRARYPQAPIYCLDHPFFYDLFCCHPFIQGFIPRQELYDKLGGIERIEKILNKLSVAEVVFWPHYGTKRPSLLPHPVHAIRSICNMIELEPLENKVSIYLTDQDLSWAKEVLTQLGKKVITFHPKASCSKNKEWYSDRWTEVIDWLKGRGFEVLQLGTAEEPAIDGATHFMGKTSIRQALALVKHSWGFIGVDSVFNHAAHSFGKPSVVLFGASTPKVWGYAESTNIYKSLKCQPCIDLGLDRCQARHCMQRITVDEVIQAMSGYLR